MLASPDKFVKPADLFKMRRKSCKSDVPSQSPMKCLKNFTDPSPVKKLPTLLRNPFDSAKPIKRRLNLRSPIKNFDGTDPTASNDGATSPPTAHHSKRPFIVTTYESSTNSNISSASSSPLKFNHQHSNNNNNINQNNHQFNNQFGNRTPSKKIRMLEIDEDANLEAPKMRANQILTPTKRNLFNNANSNQTPFNNRTPSKRTCYRNDWTLRTKLRITFNGTQCKSWNPDSSTTHKRHSGLTDDDTTTDSPSKLNDKTISLEAIKNAATVYQHPYLSWLPLYPRSSASSSSSMFMDSKHKRLAQNSKHTFSLTRHPQAIQMMHKDWCESLDDLTNLLIDGRCHFFYMCADNYNILFRSDKAKTTVQAFISPISYNMTCKLKNNGITISDNDTENERNSFENDDNDSDDDGALSGDENDDEDASQILESIGLSQQDFPTLQSRRKGFIEADSNSQTTRSLSCKPLGTVEGNDNVRKLVRFLQNNRTYTINTLGEFANIPPTLLAAREFRLSTPRYPEVIVNSGYTTKKTNSDGPLTPPKEISTRGGGQGGSSNEQAAGDMTTSSQSSSMAQVAPAAPEAGGPTFVELRGTILPSLYKKLHKLLVISDNSEHTCSSTHLESSSPFGTIQYPVC